MQALYEPMGMFGVDDECEVQVVGGLRHEMHFVFFECLHHRAKLVQNRTYPVSDEGYGSTIFDDADSTQVAEVRRQRRHRRLIGDIGADVNGHRDITLRCRNKIDRESMAAENLECVGEKPDLMPHLHGLHGNQCQSTALRDCYELWCIFARSARDHRALPVRVAGALQEQWNTQFSHRRNATRMQDATAGRGDFLSLSIM